jgi:hypothetical protein
VGETTTGIRIEVMSFYDEAAIFRKDVRHPAAAA